MTRAAANAKVAVLGASTDEEKYSFKAVQRLREHGYQPIPVHPKGHVVGGLTALRSLNEISEPIDTLSVYVNPKISSAELDNILQLGPRRVIFNPGAENDDLGRRLQQEGIEVVKACTLVMLSAEQF